MSRVDSRLERIEQRNPPRLERIEQRQLNSMSTVTEASAGIDDPELVSIKSVAEVDQFELQLAEQCYRHKIVSYTGICIICS